MLNDLKILGLLATAALFSTSAAAQQKFGHLNSGNLLEAMPEVKSANDALTIFGKKLEIRLDSMSNAFDNAVKLYKVEADAGTLTVLQMQNREAELQKMQNAAQLFSQSTETAIGGERNRLLEPILKRVDEAVKAVGKEGGYTFIFDTSTGATLFATDSDDVAAMVKKKLGI